VDQHAGQAGPSAAEAGNLFTIYLVDFEIPDITSALLQ
jgi:hypothetical protein